MKKELNMRYVARIVVEAATPLAIGAGEKSLVTDRLVARDVNGLPYIPGTSIKGVLSQVVLGEIKKKNAPEIWKNILGFQDEKVGVGSRLIISSASFVGPNKQVFEGTELPDWNNDFYSVFKSLPVRDHVRINEKGAATDGAKFDEEVVLKGTRFVFEMELIGKPEEKDEWKKLLNTFANSNFRLGGGTRKGFGELKIIEIKTRDFDLIKKEDFYDYAEKSSSLAIPIKNVKDFNANADDNLNLTEFKLILKPVDFFLFGGKGSEVADMSTVTEDMVVWENDKTPKIEKNNLLIPGSSVKGAIAHRVAFHYNKEKKLYADDEPGMIAAKAIKEKYHLPENFNSSCLNDIRKLLTIYNPAVVELFGYSIAQEDKNCLTLKNDKQKGSTIISDVFKSSTKRKVLNHVAIDRFTGGAIDGALFSEEVAALSDDERVELKVIVTKQISPEILNCLENALRDIKYGMLPLGGGVMRGNGCFEGELFKNGEKIL